MLRDLLCVGITGGFFALSVAYVRACDRIVGPDEVIGAAPATTGSGAEREPVAR